MRLISIFAILAILSTTESSSRYFVYTLTNPFDPIKNVPYPLDVCVNYDISRVGLFKVTYKYAKFICNSNNDEITMIKYGSDAKCASSGTVDTIYGLDSFNKTGDLYSFNCVGEDNYAEINIFQNDDTCCGKSYTLSNMATNVCYMNAENALYTYSMATCTANGITSRYSYNSAAADGSGCTPANISDTVDSSTYDNQCTSFKTLSPANIYVRMNKCYQNGTIIDESTFCVTTTTLPLPTSIATSTSTSTSTPSTAPTTATDAKLFGNISVMNGMIIGGVIVTLLIGICCFIKKKKVQKQFKQNNDNMVGLINDEGENNNQQPIAMDAVVRNDDQEIVGTADEIVIENAHPVLDDLDQSHLIALR